MYVRFLRRWREFVDRTLDVSQFETALEEVKFIVWIRESVDQLFCIKKKGELQSASGVASSPELPLFVGRGVSRRCFGCGKNFGRERSA